MFKFAFSRRAFDLKSSKLKINTLAVVLKQLAAHVGNAAIIQASHSFFQILRWTFIKQYQYPRNDSCSHFISESRISKLWRFLSSAKTEQPATACGKTVDRDVFACIFLFFCLLLPCFHISCPVLTHSRNQVMKKIV